MASNELKQIVNKFVENANKARATKILQLREAAINSVPELMRTIVEPTLKAEAERGYYSTSCTIYGVQYIGEYLRDHLISLGFESRVTDVDSDYERVYVSWQ